MLIPADIQATIPGLYATEKEADALARVKLFCGGYTWYVTELDPTTGEAFGLVFGQFTELGYFSIPEMEALRVGPYRVERDIHFTPTPLSAVRRQHEV